ncbi:MAG: AAA family ATPase [Paludibacteraceae bacterium]|nr:AAA family ATPase [Paludibacteraceae bacterium]
MIENFLIAQICGQLPFKANNGQLETIQKLAAFLTSTAERKAFLLRGYAGTGKTSLVSALVRAMKQVQLNCILLAPTGRAAKVMSHYAGTPAYTIHKWIYRQGSGGKFTLADNRLQHTLFIVDEASMISVERDNPVFGSGSLMDDLIRYIYMTFDLNASTNSLLLLGDEGQLPPVGQTQSKAMDLDYLQGYGLNLSYSTLTEVARQALDSGILKNATHIRLSQQISITEENDVHLMPPQNFIEELERAYQEVGLAETVILTRSNRRANLYNRGVRAQILFREEELSTGDRLMVSRNNYFWNQPYEGLPFLANGDTLEIIRLRNERELYGFRFIDASVRLLDYDWEIDATLWMDTLTTASPEDNNALSQTLYNRIAEDYPEIRNRKELDEQIRKSPYFNALQVRFAYAVTCHKAQGGQWERVFIDPGQPLPNEDEQNRLRWYYTALTRAKSEVYILNTPHKE